MYISCVQEQHHRFKSSPANTTISRIITYTHCPLSSLTITRFLQFVLDSLDSAYHNSRLGCSQLQVARPITSRDGGYYPPLQTQLYARPYLTPSPPALSIDKMSIVSLTRHRGCANEPCCSLTQHLLSLPTRPYVHACVFLEPGTRLLYILVSNSTSLENTHRDREGGKCSEDGTVLTGNES
jgi:hypothetical protein